MIQEWSPKSEGSCLVYILDSLFILARLGQTGKRVNLHSSYSHVELLDLSTFSFRLLSYHGKGYKALYKKRLVFWSILIVSVYSFTEGISYLGLVCMEKFRNRFYVPANTVSGKHRAIIERMLTGETQYIIYDKELGWTIRANAVFPLPDDGGAYKSNSVAIRSDREYDAHTPASVLRIAAFGDSFTHCDDVDNYQTWQAIMERTDENLEVMNFGVRGYGLDQAYLRYLKQGMKYRPHIVFIDFMSENICRNVNVYRPFYQPGTSMPLSKPRYFIENGELVLTPNPLPKFEDYGLILEEPDVILPRMGASDYFYHSLPRSNIFDFSPAFRLGRLLMTKHNTGDIFTKGQYNTSSEAFEVTIGIVGKFHNEVIKNGSIPIVVIFPDGEDIGRQKVGKPCTYSPLLEYLDSKDYEYVDLMNAFNKAGARYSLKELFVDSSNHYSPLANRIVAGYLSDYLRKEGYTQKDAKQ